MLQLIPIALFTLASFSSANAAPTSAAMMNEASSMVEGMSVDTVNSTPMNWKRNHQQHGNIISGDFIDAAIAKAMSEQNMMMVKRQSEESAPSFDLNTLFRGIFDNVINHIIEVTPLNDIVHGNYDFLYELFMNKVSEVISNIGSDAGKGLAPGTEEPNHETKESHMDEDEEYTDEKDDDEEEDDDDEENYDDEDEDDWEEEDDEEDYDEDNEEWKEDDEESHKHWDNDEE